MLVELHCSVRAVVGGVRRHSAVSPRSDFARFFSRKEMEDVDCGLVKEEAVADEEISIPVPDDKVDKVKDADVSLQGAAAKENGEFDYLNRNQFTSENFKIIIRNMPKYFGTSVRSRKVHCELAHANYSFSLAMEKVPGQPRNQTLQVQVL